MKSEGDKITGGTQQFNRECWDEVEFVWNRKPFLRASLPEVFRVPIVDNIDSVTHSLEKKVAELGATEADAKKIILRHPLSAWKEEVLVSLDKPVADPHYVELTGTFRSKVFVGNSTQLRSFFKQMDSYLATQNEKALTYYAFKTSCHMASNNYEECTYVIIAQVTNTKNGVDTSFDIDMTIPQSTNQGGDEDISKTPS